MDFKQLFVIGVQHGYILQILIAEFLFMVPLKKPHGFAVRLIIGLLVALPCMVVVPNIVSMFVSGFFSLTIFLLTLAMWKVVLRRGFREVLFCCIGAQLMQNLSYNIESLIYHLFPDAFTPLPWLCLSIGCMALTYSVCFVVFVQRMNMDGAEGINGIYVYPFAVLCALFTYLMQYSFQVYGIDRIWVVRPPLILCCLAGLCVQSGLVALKTGADERLLLERMLRGEARQYRIERESMDLINMKAHDLKHQIARIRAHGSTDDAELDNIEALVARYENQFDTGNRDLDLVLGQKQLLCKQSDINLTVIAQGEAVSFLQPADLSSLFGNLLDNAIEHERTVSPASRRSIAVSIRAKGAMDSVSVENYAPDVKNQKTWVEGLPHTTKGDIDNHGFGLRSVRYLVRKYDGTLQLGVSHDCFVANILFPSQSNLVKK
ncbi:ATP-binding protein [Bifidobacterium sp. ESL0745]|uniref:ATP-binding protein n=1 Tax=Bifidobacterium sp. ESL0745 TaxID=2983226 RepID=UPI0023F7C30A|nr:ATP-binding protein [Bifidobacterium sp. ESL0745]MDF7666145.1 ATP-binding protein [Bifidobacterium sp. ESL0745]